MLTVVRAAVLVAAAAAVATAAETAPQLRGTAGGGAAAGAAGVTPASVGRLLAGVAAQAAQRQRRLAFRAASLGAGGAGARRLQSAALCAWSNRTRQCSVSDAYTAEKLASLPADSPVRAVWQGEMVCSMATNSKACAKMANCSWDMADKRCAVSLSPEAQARLLGLNADPAGCGVLGAMFSRAQCSGLDVATCRATTGCALVDGQALSPAGTCAKAKVCEPKDDSVSSLAAQLCPAADATCRADDTCLAKECPAFARVRASAAQLRALAGPDCGSFDSNETCYWGSNETDTGIEAEMCTWNADTEFCESGAPVSSWQVLPALMQDVPDSCALKGFMMKAAKCAGMDRASCTGDCTWEMTPWCDDIGRVHTEEACTVSVDFVLGSTAGGATEKGDKGVDLLLQAEAACAAKTGQSDCLAVPRPPGDRGDDSVGRTSAALPVAAGALPALTAAVAAAVFSG